MRRNKYNNKINWCDGIKFSSIKEMKRYGELKLMEHAGHISKLKLQPSFEIVIKGQKICKYIADFTYFNSKQIRIVEDVKGYKKGAAYQMFKLKKKLMKALHGIEIFET